MRRGAHRIAETHVHLQADVGPAQGGAHLDPQALVFLVFSEGCFTRLNAIRFAWGGGEVCEVA